MRDIKLGREEVQHLRDEIRKAQEPILAKKKIEEEKRQELQRAKEKARLEQFDKIKNSVTELENLKSIKVIEECEEKITSLEKEIKECGFSSAERKKQLQRLVPIKDKLEEKREDALLALPEDKKEALRQLKSVLAQKKDRRKIVKEQLEAMRKAAGSSGLDFEQSLNINDQIANEKLRLEKMDISIEEVIVQIATLKKG